MYIRTQNGFGDGDLGNLQSLLSLIDGKLSSITDLVRQRADADSDGLFDEAEYFIGVALTAIQQYIGTTFAQFKMCKSKALQLPPRVNENLTLVEALNAGANFWKHKDEWGIRNNVFREVDSLNGQAQKTIKTIEFLTPWDDYTLCNLIACLAPSGKLRLVELVPQITEWRDSVDALNGEGS